MNEPGPCILIVDDNARNIQILGTILRKENYQIIIAQNGGQAVHAVSRKTPDLILLDVMMPEMDGFETCKKIKESSRAKDVPVIFLTARTETEDILKGFEAGAVDYVTKPFNIPELLTRIKTHIELNHRRKLQGVLEMAGAVCHEMNQPLQTMMGYAELMLMDIQQDDPLREKILKIKEQTDRMAKITQKLMRITRYETRDYGIGQQIVDLEKAVEKDE
jgi:DNA-binding response OmpR family regulator